jgi:hypothetical protein
LNAPVFWEADLDTGVVLLQGLVSTSGQADVDHVPSIKFTEICSSVEGTYGVCGDKRDRVPILLLGGASPDRPLAFVISFGNTAPGRLTAVARFLSLQRGRMLPDTRLTPLRRQRLRQLLRSFDARSSGASHRDIAAALFCRHRVAGPDWHESSLRYAVIRLVHDCAALVQGRYRTILQHRGNT